MNDCSKCKQSFEMSPDNTVVYVFAKDPIADHARIECPVCKTTDKLYLRPGKMEELTARGIPIVQEKRAPSATIKAARKAWCDLDESSSAASYTREHMYDLTPRMEKEVEQFARKLAATPHSVISWVMSDPAPAPSRPQRWIN